MPLPKKILITGASGFLGYHLLRAARQKGFSVFGQYHQGVVNFSHSGNFKIDLRSYTETGNVIDEIEPDVVVHAAAIANANICQNDRALSYAVNVEASRNLAGICSDYQAQFVFISTDLVFDGRKGYYSEEDKVSPLMVYGEHKALAERQVTEIYPASLVVRCPLMFGDPEASAKNYLPDFIRSLKEGRPVNLFSDEYRSVCGAKSVAEGIIHVCEEESGLLHIAGRERVSRLEFGLVAAKAYGLDSSLIRPCLQSEAQLAAPRPPDVSLNISKAAALGYSPMDFREELQNIADGNYYRIGLSR